MTLLVVMGVSGSGKTTIAAGIAQQEGWRLLGGDKLYPLVNVAKVEAGIPLPDDDRWPWLRAMAARAADLHVGGEIDDRRMICAEAAAKIA